MFRTDASLGAWSGRQRTLLAISVGRASLWSSSPWAGSAWDLCFAFTLGLLVAGCSTSAPRESQGTAGSGQLDNTEQPVILLRWVGAVEETDVRVALLAGKGKARLYFCGGAGSVAHATRWFELAYDGGEHIDFEEKPWRVHAHLTAGGLRGEVELGDGMTRALHAERVVPGTLTGLYEGRAACGRVGLIVSQASKDASPSAQGACIDDADAPAQQVSAITPISSEIRVLTPGAGDEPLQLQAATLDPL